MGRMGAGGGNGNGGITEFAGEVTITTGTKTGFTPHGLGLTPDVKKVSVKPKDGTDPGGDTITVTTDGTNITVNVVSGPWNESWVFEVHYKSG